MWYLSREGKFRLCGGLQQLHPSPRQLCLTEEGERVKSFPHEDSIKSPTKKGQTVPVCPLSLLVYISCGLKQAMPQKAESGAPDA